MLPYPPLAVRVVTPRIELHGATDDLLERVHKWLQGIWRGRGNAKPEFWRLHFVVMVDGEPIGMQDLIGHDFETFGTVETFSWLSSDARQRGVGTETRSAILHLAFDGLGASEAHSEANIDNAGSNGVSERLGYQRNGTAWATCDGKPVLGQRWRLERQTWADQRRNDIEMNGVEACRAALGIRQ